MSIISAESSTRERKFHALNEQKRQLEALKRQPTLKELFFPKPADDLRSISKDILFLDLEPHHCRYAHDDGPFLFCGNDVQDGSSYCPGHHALCWTAPIARTTKARKYYGTDFSVRP